MIFPVHRLSRAAILLLLAVTGAGADDGPQMPDGIANTTVTGTEYGSVTLSDGAWRNTATTALGDRVKVTDASIGPHGVEVDVIEHDEDDPACCPTRAATRRYDTRLNPLPQTENES